MRIEDSVGLSRTILHCANQGLPRVDFLREISNVLLDFSGCDAVALRLSEGDLHYRWEMQRWPAERVQFELARWTYDDKRRVIPVSREDTVFERLCRLVAAREFDPTLSCFTENGSFWAGDAPEAFRVVSGAAADLRGAEAGGDGAYPSRALIRFFVDEQTVGLLHLKSRQRDHFTADGIEVLEGLAQTVGLASADRRAQAALRERVKELTCLYGIALEIEKAGATSLDEILRHIVELLPPAWRFPEIAAARIVIDDHAFATRDFRRAKHHQCADIVVRGIQRGSVEIVYLEERLEFQIGAFLEEERNLIQAVAREVALLYGIALEIDRAGATSLSEILLHIVELLPAALRFPGIAAARIIVDGRAYATPGFEITRDRQTARVTVGGRQRGVVDVVYLDERPEFDSGAFSQEEEKLIGAVAREVGLLIERKEAHEEKSKLEGQLIHADRLATIGQLAAGVAHELNEPLGSILGFAQLVTKCPDVPQQAVRDINKIIDASLYAREIIKKLLLFGRQMPPRKVKVDLNSVLDEGLYFLEARCAKDGVAVVRDLASGLPEVTADPAQLNQVVVNLVVNALQAMPDGGTLTLRTSSDESNVMLAVQDTGPGISEELQGLVFLPFFTTKDVNEGTGLGLAVVHGIVSAHNGSIEIESAPGRGARFEVRLPVAAADDVSEDG